MLSAKAIGRLVADPQLRTIKKGEKEFNVCEFKLACQQRKDEVDFVKVAAWRGMGDFIFNHVTKGQKIFVEGKLKIPPYDNEKGRAYEPYLVVFNFEFCDSKKKEPVQPQNSETSPDDSDLLDTLSEDDINPITE